MIDLNDERHQLWMHGYYAGRIDERKQQEPPARWRRLLAAVRGVKMAR